MESSEGETLPATVQDDEQIDDEEIEGIEQMLRWLLKTEKEDVFERVVMKLYEEKVENIDFYLP